MPDSCAVKARPQSMVVMSNSRVASGRGMKGQKFGKRQCRMAAWAGHSPCGWYRERRARASTAPGLNAGSRARLGHEKGETPAGRPGVRGQGTSCGFRAGDSGTSWYPSYGSVGRSGRRGIAGRGSRRRRIGFRWLVVLVHAGMRHGAVHAGAEAVLPPSGAGALPVPPRAAVLQRLLLFGGKAVVERLELGHHLTERRNAGRIEVEALLQAVDDRGAIGHAAAARRSAGVGEGFLAVESGRPQGIEQRDLGGGGLTAYFT